MHMQKSNMRLYRIFLKFLCLMLVMAIMPHSVFAAEPVDLDRDLSLTIDYRPGDNPLPDVGFSVYKVADMSADPKFALTDTFSPCTVSLKDLDSAGWKRLANTLGAYVARDKLPELDRATTKEQGQLTFPQEGQILEPGLYLVLGEETSQGNYTYSPEPFLISLPNLNTEDQWEYDVTVVPKYDSKPDGQDEKVDRKVLKVWDDEGWEEHRPEEITVELLRDGEVFDIIKLTEEDGWRYTWKGLDGAHKWQVVEKDIPEGYTVSISQENTTFVITNTGSDEFLGTTDPEKPKKPGKPGGGGGGGKLPQTGMLWWPVPALAASGILVFLLGWARNSKGKEENGE